MVVPFLQNSTFTGLISTRDFGTSQDWQTGYLNTISFTTTGINDSIANYLSSNNVVIKAAVINENLINTGELVSFNGGTAIGNFSFAANDARAEGTTTFAVNDGTAIGEHSSAQNRGTSIGIFSIATGHETQAIGDFSHVEGTFTAASGVAAHAEGSNTQATGNYSHAEGEGTQALEESSHAEGYQTVALGKNSHAQGAFTIAGGENSHAGGAYAQTIYDRSWVWKGSTITDVLSTTRSDQFMVSAEGGIVLSNKVGIGTDSIDNALTVIGTISTSEHGNSEKWFSNYTTVQNNSATNWNYQGTDIKDLSSNWQNSYTTVQNNSATNWNYQGTDLKNLSGNWQNSYTVVNQSSSIWFNTSATSVNYAHTNFLPLTGGIISGPTRINNNLTIFGNLTASGVATFANTVFSTTTSLSVVHIGSGPALWVGNNGDGDIASFYDIDQNIEVLHVGGINGSNPNVGIKTSTPNKDFTVKGEISASNTIYEGTGNSNQWNQAYSVATTYQNISSNWQSTFATVCALSASWEESADIIPTVTNYLSTNRVQVSALIIANTFSDINSLTISGNISGNNLRTSFNQGSATGDYSFAVGFGRAFGRLSHAEGAGCRATGDYSHAEGGGESPSRWTLASGIASHAEGLDTHASGEASHAQNNFTRASGDYSHAEGSSTTASGQASHAQNTSTQASGESSHAEGRFTRARGSASHAGGSNAEAAHDRTWIWKGSTSTTSLSTTRADQFMVSAAGGTAFFGNVGIGTDNNQNALTIVGTISTVNGTSNQWNSTTTTVQTNSATNWNYQGTDIKNLSGNWQSTYLTVSTLSALWEESADIIPTVTNYLSTSDVLISSLRVTNGLTVTGNISASNIIYAGIGNSSQWDATYTTVSSNSASWVAGGDSILTIKFLSNPETFLELSANNTFIKTVTGSNTFTFSNFTSGKTLTLFLTANHTQPIRHYFPQPTYFDQLGEGNTVYTFNDNVTKITIQNIGTQYIGTATLIPLTTAQYIAPTGDSVLLDGVLGYLLLEDGSYLLL